MRVFEDSKLEQFYSWEISLVAKGKVIKNLSLANLTYDHNYLDDYGCDITCEIKVPMGTYHRDIVPNENNLICILERAPVNKASNQNHHNNDILKKTYRVILNIKPSNSIKGTTVNNVDYDTLDLHETRTVKFQLMELSVEAMRRVTVGVIPVGHDVTTVIRYMLTSISKQLKLPDSERIRGVDIVKANNTETYEELVIPDGVKLHDVADYIQNQYGVYSCGLSCYLSDGLWYVFPKFDVSRYDDETNTLTILNLPANKYPHVEASFYKNNREVIVLSTGEISHLDDTSVRMYNHGNGVRFSDGNKIIDGFSQYDNGEVTADRSDNSVEFISDNSLGNRSNVFVSNTTITTNRYSEFSKLARSKVEHLMLVWHNADPFVLYPGQPVRFIYQNGETTSIAKGVLAKAVYHVSTAGMISSKRYSCDAALTLLIERTR